MIWIGLSVSALIVAALVLARPQRAEKDMGSVSRNWIAEHRSETNG